MDFLNEVQSGKFCITVEFTPHDASGVRHVAEIAKGLVELNKKYSDSGILFTGVSLTQNPGGSLSYDHLAALAILRENGFPEELEIVPHLTGKDMNVDGLRTLMRALADQGVDSFLALTGDLSDVTKGVFEVDSLGVLEVAREVNYGLLKGAKDDDDLMSRPQLKAGAAVSPYKYTRGALAMQLIKASKKIRSGAAFLVCQSGWDAQRSEQLIKELEHENTPILGNVLIINEVAGKYMQELPGCVVTDEFIQTLHGETADDALKRGGQQIAMFRDLGYAGVDLGKPGDFRSIDEIERVIDTALATANWRDVADNITFSPGNHPAPPMRHKAGFSWGMHKHVFEENGALHDLAAVTLKPFDKSSEKEGALYRLFLASEAAGKGLLYECENCGDCFLPENGYICTWGACEKKLPNPPCGDAEPDGTCGNNPNKICAGERIYYRMLKKNEIENFKKAVLPRRNPDLDDTASVLNQFFGRDHTTRQNPLASSGLIQIGELLHASIPFPGAAMDALRKQGDEGFRKTNPALLAFTSLVQEQAKLGADYLDINIDALGDADAPGLMRKFLHLIHENSLGVPACIDSSDINVLLAGLDEWRILGKATKPLVNSIPYQEMDKYDALFDLRREQPFSVICLLMGLEGPLASSDEMVEAARKMFKRAKASGFQADEIFFDCVTLGIASDGCMDAMGNIKASHTHHSFHAIERIMNDPEMKGVHTALGVSNWVYGATKRRIGHVRAFIDVAHRFGLDTVIVDVAKEFGVRPAAPELIDFVQTYVDLDGGDDSMMAYSEAMANARAMAWI